MQTRLGWVTELQLLLRKDGPTISKAIDEVLGGVIGVIRDGAVAIVYRVVGDAVNTNENALNRWFANYGREFDGQRRVVYMPAS